MDTKLQTASDGLDQYSQTLTGIKRNMESALKQYAALLCQPLREIEAQYAVVVQAIRQEKEARQASCPHQSVIECKFDFFRDRLCTDCGLEESAGTSRLLDTAERSRFRKLIGKPTRVTVAEYRDKRKQVFGQMGETILREWQTIAQEGNTLPGRIVSALPKIDESHR
jgi:hypothetical protein